MYLYAADQGSNSDIPVAAARAPLQQSTARQVGHKATCPPALEQEAASCLLAFSGYIIE